MIKIKTQCRDIFIDACTIGYQELILPDDFKNNFWIDCYKCKNGDYKFTTISHNNYYFNGTYCQNGFDYLIKYNESKIFLDFNDALNFCNILNQNVKKESNIFEVIPITINLYANYKSLVLSYNYLIQNFELQLVYKNTYIKILNYIELYKEYQNNRSCEEYTYWRSNVFKRDDYTCKCCNKKGGKLESHHIKPYAIYIGDRYILENGLTLCYECHKKLHKKYGFSNIVGLNEIVKI